MEQKFEEGKKGEMKKIIIILLIIIMAILTSSILFINDEVSELKRINAEQKQLIQMKDKQISLLVVLATGEQK